MYVQEAQMQREHGYRKRPMSRTHNRVTTEQIVEDGFTIR